MVTRQGKHSFGKKNKIKIKSWTWRVSRAKVMKAKYNDIS
jgi:hypothetical protein